MVGSAADAPVALSASGQAVADGKLYIVGGCTTSACTPMSATWRRTTPPRTPGQPIADYPRQWRSRPAVGSTARSTAPAATAARRARRTSYVYDPGADTWSPIADAPVATWASGAAVANGDPGRQRGRSGRGDHQPHLRLRPADGDWGDLPNSNTARYRGAMSCGIYKIGGSSGGFTATVDSETLPGFEDCGASAADVEWLSSRPTTATWRPASRSRST